MRRGLWAVRPEAAVLSLSLTRSRRLAVLQSRPATCQKKKNDRRGRQFRRFHLVRQIGIGHVDGYNHRAFSCSTASSAKKKKRVCSAFPNSHANSLPQESMRKNLKLYKILRHIKYCGIIKIITNCTTR